MVCPAICVAIELTCPPLHRLHLLDLLHACLTDKADRHVRADGELGPIPATFAAVRDRLFRLTEGESLALGRWNRHSGGFGTRGDINDVWLVPDYGIIAVVEKGIFEVLWTQACLFGQLGGAVLGCVRGVTCGREVALIGGTLFRRF